MRLLIVTLSLLFCGTVFAANGQEAMRRKMTGRWDRPNRPTVFTFAPTGEAIQFSRPDAKVLSRGRINWIDAETATIQWNNGWSWEIYAAANDHLACYDKKQGEREDDGFVLERAK